MDRKIHTGGEKVKMKTGWIQILREEEGGRKGGGERRMEGEDGSGRTGIERRKEGGVSKVCKKD